MLSRSPIDPGAITQPTGGAAVLPAGGSAEALPAGTRLQEFRFTTGRVLGRGGMGITYLGAHVKRRSAVAIKEFLPHGCRREGARVIPGGTHTPESFAAARDRFARVWRQIGFLDHPGIIRVALTFEENDTAYVVMEYLRGRSLADLVAERGPLPEEEALAFVRQVAETLWVVHDAGFLHLDLKPEHLVLCEDGRLVLVDCDTAREMGGDRSPLPPLLTPGYAPLEQYGEHVRLGVYTDLYALAATLYHLLTGRPPPSAPDRARGIGVPHPRQMNPQVSRITAEALARGLAMRVPERPASARAFINLLPVTPETVEPEAAPEETGPRLPAVFRRMRRSPANDEPASG